MISKCTWFSWLLFMSIFSAEVYFYFNPQDWCSIGAISCTKISLWLMPFTVCFCSFTLLLIDTKKEKEAGGENQPLIINILPSAPPLIYDSSTIADNANKNTIL